MPPLKLHEVPSSTAAAALVTVSATPSLQVDSSCAPVAAAFWQAEPKPQAAPSLSVHTSSVSESVCVLPPQPVIPPLSGMAAAPTEI